MTFALRKPGLRKSSTLGSVYMQTQWNTGRFSHPLFGAYPATTRCNWVTTESEQNGTNAYHLATGGQNYSHELHSNFINYHFMSSWWCTEHNLSKIQEHPQRLQTQYLNLERISKTLNSSKDRINYNVCNSYIGFHS